MTKIYNLYQIDSFTNKIFEGNPAGVVTNADGLLENDMKKIACEMNVSETAFIFTENIKDCDMEIRYFTPRCEVPICGHATIAAHYALALEKNHKSGTYIQKCKVGLLPIKVINNDGNYKIVMTQGEIEFLDTLKGETLASLLSALNLTTDDILENHPIRIVSTGHSKVMIGLKSEEILHTLNPDFARLIEVSRKINCNGFYTFAYDTKSEGILTTGRMFAPAVGINEDPVTGNANGPLGAYLVRHGLIQHDGSVASFKIIQGEKMGRRGEIEVQVIIKDNMPTKVSITGEAVLVFKTTISI